MTLRFTNTIKLLCALISLSLLCLASCVAPTKPVITSGGNRSSGDALRKTDSGTQIAAQPGATVASAQVGAAVEANAVVTHVVDGDTADVVFRETNHKERIRLIGIDTPETKKPNTPIECFGREASASLNALLPEGTAVRVERDVEERDRYGRLLGYVYRANDGLFVNLEMVRAGMALPLTFPPNVMYTDKFLEAGDAARTAQVGLWTRCESGHDAAS
jgi:micrococcal nuclease